MPEIPQERPQPYEVPYREVEHQEEDDVRQEFLPLGHVRDNEWWDLETDEERSEWEADIRRRMAARGRLKGGFGFH